MKRLLVIQEHKADKAGLHWDLRFEFHGDLELYEQKRPVTNEPTDSLDLRVLRSFAIPKAKLPSGKEFLLAMETEDHPWEYKDFEGEIKQGYGKGLMKLLHNDYIEVSIFEKDKIHFKYNGSKYNMWRATFTKNPKAWMIKEISNC